MGVIEKAGRPVEQGGRSQRGIWLLSAIPDVLLAATYFIAWAQPERFPDGMLRSMLLTWPFEMMILIATSFMAFAVNVVPRGAFRTGCFVLASIQTLLFILLLSGVIRALWPLVGFLTLMVNRALPLLGGKRDDDADRTFKVGAVLTLISFFICSLLAFSGEVPALGLTDEVGTRLRVQPPSAAAELISFGAFYFAAVAISELIAGMVPARPLRQRSHRT